MGGPRVAAGGMCALVAIGVVACSLGDFSGFTNGDAPSDGGAAVEAATPGTDDGGTDADAALPTTEAGAFADAGARFCDRNADAGVFCEDFEGPSPLQHFANLVTLNGTLIVDDRAMVADAPASANESQVYGVISGEGNASMARLEFRVRPEQLNLTTAHSTQIAKFLFFGASNYEVGIGVRGKDTSEVYTYEFTPGYYKEFGSLAPLQPASYTQFVLEVRIKADASGAPRLTVDRNGARVVVASLTPPLAQGTLEAFVGVPYIQAGHGAYKFRFDDILMGIP